MINVTGLWTNKTKNGETYLSGSIGNMQVLIFKNNNKKSDKAPDYNLCFAEKQKKEGDNKGDNFQQDNMPNPWNEQAPF